MLSKIILTALLFVSSAHAAYDTIRVCKGQITYSGGTPTAASNAGCVSSVTDNGTGDATLNFATGYFSVAPTCLCSPARAAGGSCQEGGNGAYASPTTTTARLASRDSTFSFADANFNFVCIGIR